jgi:hypothetical protein
VKVTKNRAKFLDYKIILGSLNNIKCTIFNSKPIGMAAHFRLNINITANLKIKLNGFAYAV